MTRNEYVSAVTGRPDVNVVKGLEPADIYFKEMVDAVIEMFESLDTTE